MLLLCPWHSCIYMHTYKNYLKIITRKSRIGERKVFLSRKKKKEKKRVSWLATSTEGLNDIVAGNPALSALILNAFFYSTSRNIRDNWEGAQWGNRIPRCIMKRHFFFFPPNAFVPLRFSIFGLFPFPIFIFHSRAAFVSLLLPHCTNLPIPTKALPSHEDDALLGIMCTSASLSI